MSLGAGMVAKPLLALLKKYSEEFQGTLEQEYGNEYRVHWSADEDALSLSLQKLSQDGSVVSGSFYKITIEKKPE